MADVKSVTSVSVNLVPSTKSADQTTAQAVHASNQAAVDTVLAPTNAEITYGVISETLPVTLLPSTANNAVLFNQTGHQFHVPSDSHV